MKKDLAIIFTVVSAVILGALAGAVTGRSGSIDRENHLKTTQKLEEITGHINEIEKRLDRIEAGMLRTAREKRESEKPHDPENKAVSDNPLPIGSTSQMEKEEVPPEPETHSEDPPKRTLQPAGDLKRILANKYESQAKNVKKRIRIIRKLSKQKGFPLSSSQEESLENILLETLKKKKEFDLAVIDTPEREQERTLEFGRIDEEERNAVLGLLGQEQYQLYELSKGELRGNEWHPARNP